MGCANDEVYSFNCSMFQSMVLCQLFRDSVFNRTLKISDFKVVAILGVGGFGRVQLVCE